jgi:hypothetical protein
VVHTRPYIPSMKTLHLSPHIRPGSSLEAILPQNRTLFPGVRPALGVTSRHRCVGRKSEGGRATEAFSFSGETFVHEIPASGVSSLGWTNMLCSHTYMCNGLRQRGGLRKEGNGTEGTKRRGSLDQSVHEPWCTPGHDIRAYVRDQQGEHPVTRIDT